MSERENAGDRALVTGATGFLGRALCRELLDRGWDVTGTKRASSDVPDLDMAWVEADALDRAAVFEAVEGHERIFHLAGVGLMSADEETVWRVNVEGTRNVLDACRETGAERVVFTSTAGTRRRDDGPADEDDRAEPVGAYQGSKARAETLVDEYAAEYDAVTVHPTSVFGPGDEKFTVRLLALATDPKMVAYLPGGASIVGVEDAAAGIVAAMERGESGEHYILGGENLAYGDALATLARLADGSTPRVRVPAPAIRAAGPVAGVVNDALGTHVFPFNADMARLSTGNLFYDSSKAERELGYEHRPLADHASEAVRWYLEEREG